MGWLSRAYAGREAAGLKEFRVQAAEAAAAAAAEGGDGGGRGATPAPDDTPLPVCVRRYLELAGTEGAGPYT